MAQNGWTGRPGGGNFKFQAPKSKETPSLNLQMTYPPDFRFQIPNFKFQIQNSGLAIGYRLSAIGYRLSAIGYRRLAIGDWRLAIQTRPTTPNIGLTGFD
jgi:hypothetical protein